MAKERRYRRRMFRILGVAAAALLALGSCATPQQLATSAYSNPVIDSDFPDPAVIAYRPGER